ncbi:MAG: type II toxin-antitoxin system VapC family toxin [Xanthomonadales bacterium]|jgi:predicted nucleic acid-binding protein|nr:type II toxin-antitoxin system VapC family toxin [Xanthomonadales bacterium]
MYLVDTDVLNEARKQSRANPGVREFLRNAASSRELLYLSVVTIGEFRRGIERIRARGESSEAVRMERWLERILEEYPDHVLGFDSEAAQLWGALRLPRDFDTLDRQIAATARIHDLTLVTRRAHAWSGCGVAALNPFTLGPGG